MHNSKLLATTLCIFFFLGNSLTDIRAQCAKFEPPYDKALLIMGQDLGATGGFNAPDNDGYYENVGEDTVAGVTTYISLRNLNGMTNFTNWGAGNICGQCIIDNPIYDNSVLSIGLFMVGQLASTAAGDFDDEIRSLANWVKSTDRPVFLRIGYEFDLQYVDERAIDYVKAYRRVVDIFREMEVENCAFVWQAAHGTDSWPELVQRYPGDPYVDWFGYSHFSFNGKTMIDVARQKKKPVMIAEATPIGNRLDEIDGEVVWRNWFEVVFDYIEANKDVIKAFAYINQDWDTQWLWRPCDCWGNSKVQDNDYILSRWEEQVLDPFWLKASDTLFSYLEECDSNFVQPEDDGSLFKLYPNPTEQNITLEFTDLPEYPIELEMVTPYSKTNTVFEYEPKQIISFYVGDFAPGVYLIKIITGLDVKVTSFVKI